MGVDRGGTKKEGVEFSFFETSGMAKLAQTMMGEGGGKRL